MTRRNQNRAKLRAAGRAAMNAQAWIGAAFLDRLANNDGVPEGVLKSRGHFSSRRGMHSLVPALLRLFRDIPEFAPWCERPEHLRLLARYAGAAQIGGAFRSVVDNARVQEFVAQLGEPIWRYAIEHGKSNMALIGNTGDFVERMDAAGGENVHAFLLQVAQDVHQEIEFAARLKWCGSTTKSGVEPDLTLIRTLLREVKPSA